VTDKPKSDGNDRREDKPSSSNPKAKPEDAGTTGEPSDNGPSLPAQSPNESTETSAPRKTTQSHSWTVRNRATAPHGLWVEFANPGNTRRSSPVKAKVESLPKDVTKDTSEEELVDNAVDVTPESRSADARARSEELQNEILEAERDRVRQQKGHRTAFFFWAVIAISIILIFNSIIFVVHMVATGGEPNDAVIISWMSTSIVEVIGLGYIIARSLFLSPSGGANGSQAAARSSD